MDGTTPTPTATMMHSLIPAPDPTWTAATVFIDLTQSRDSQDDVSSPAEAPALSEAPTVSGRPRRATARDPDYSPIAFIITSLPWVPSAIVATCTPTTGRM